MGYHNYNIIHKILRYSIYAIYKLALYTLHLRLITSSSLKPQCILYTFGVVLRALIFSSFVHTCIQALYRRRVVQKLLPQWKKEKHQKDVRLSLSLTVFCRSDFQTTIINFINLQQQRKKHAGWKKKGTLLGRLLVHCPLFQTYSDSIALTTYSLIYRTEVL